VEVVKMWEQKINVIYEFGEPNRSDSTVEVVLYPPDSDVPVPG
jgi:hypothetical protein